MISLVPWTDDPLSGANDAKGVYLNEMQNNANFVQEKASKGISQWTNATAGLNFRLAHVDELTSSLENPALLSYYGFSSIADALGRPWGSLPSVGATAIGGYGLLNDIRRVIDAMVAALPLTHAFNVICEPDAARNVAFDLTIQAYKTDTFEVDTDYAPAQNVLIWLEDQEGEIIAPTFTDNTGWSSGEKTVSVTISGGAGARRLRINCRDEIDLAAGFAHVAVDGSAVSIPVDTRLGFSLYNATASESQATTFTAANWASMWDKTRNGTDGTPGTADPDRLGWYAQRQISAGAYYISSLRLFRTHLRFDISAYKGTILSASIAFEIDLSFWDFLTGAASAPDSWLAPYPDQAWFATYTIAEAPTGASNLDKWNDMLALSEAGRNEVPDRSWRTMKWMWDTWGAVSLPFNSVEASFDGDFLDVIILERADFDDERLFEWPGDVRYYGPLAYMAVETGNIELRIITK